MKLMIASDIHGSAYFCERLLEAFDRETADRMLLLGDILYHGPRNDLPRGYAPKQVLAMLNAVKTCLFCVRGNCDTEVDQMVLEFPILAALAAQRHTSAWAHACSCVGALWRRESVSESRLGLHPQKRQPERLYDFGKPPRSVENTGRRDLPRGDDLGQKNASLHRFRCRLAIL